MGKAPPSAATRATAQGLEAEVKWPQARGATVDGGGCAGGKAFGDVAGASVAPELGAARLTQDQTIDAWLRANHLLPTAELRARALRCPKVFTETLRCLSASAGPAFFASARLPLLKMVDGIWTNSAAKGYSGRYMAIYQLPKLCWPGRE